MTACLGLVTPVGAQSPSGGSAYAPGDGAPTRAACAALGFEIYKEPVNIYQRFLVDFEAQRRAGRAGRRAIAGGVNRSVRWRLRPHWSDQTQTGGHADPGPQFP